MLASLASALAVSVAMVADSLPHPATRFTQGLFFDGKELWESTGLEGRSWVYRMDARGHGLDSVQMPGMHFGEGIAKVGNRITWLTWRSGLAWTLSAQPLQMKGSFAIPTEGWGLTVWRGQLLMSNGSAELLVLSPDDHRVVNSIAVKADGRPLAMLNELEAVGDTLYANVWQSDSIAVIALPSGKVTRWIDCSALASKVRKRSPGAEVLNGIAFDGKHLWITGKLWPQMYRLR